MNKEMTGVYVFLLHGITWNNSTESKELINSENNYLG